MSPPSMRNVSRAVLGGVLFVAGPLLLHCGARTGLDGGRAGGGGPAGPGDAGLPLGDGPVLEASACVPPPAGGIAIGSPPESVVSIALAVAGGTVYAGTASIGSMGALYAGAIASVPSGGGSAQTLTAPAYNFGNLATDGARLYYPQTRGMAQGSGSAIYTVLGLASIDLATGAVQPIATPAPPWSTSSNLNSDMIAATSAWPGVFWIGGTSGAGTPGALSSWSAQTGAVTTLATGQSLSGVAVDATGVYWADTGGGQGITVYGAPLGGGRTSTLVNVPGGTHGVLLGVSAADVVFVTDYATGVIEAVSKTGGAARPLVTASSAWVNAFAWVDETSLYWTESTAPSTLRRIPVAGGTPEIVPTQGQLQSLAFDACNVYVGSLGPAQVLVEAK